MKYFSSSVLLTFSLASKRRVRGVAVVLLLFLVGAVAVLAAFNSDSTRMSGDAAQLKRATDAAALAATMAYARDSKTNVQEMAERYVRANLGLDDEQLQPQLVVSTEKIKTDDDRQGWRVRASFVAHSMLRGANAQEVSVQSAAVAMNKAIEVSLAIPNSSKEIASQEMEALRNVGNYFAQQLIEGRRNAWLALVPYNGSVNVSPEVGLVGSGGSRGPGAQHLARLRNWTAPGALRPTELNTLWREYAGHGDRRLPDRKNNLLCLFRGVKAGQNYFWENAPSSSFRVYYRRPDTWIEGNPERFEGYARDTLTWYGPRVDPIIGIVDPVLDNRSLAASVNLCPHAPLLPLANNLNNIHERLRIMRHGSGGNFNNAPDIAIGWSAMALNPSFRGVNGWGNSELPLDFDTEGGNTTKAIVLMYRPTDDYPYDMHDFSCFSGSNSSFGGCLNKLSINLTSLCRSIRERKIHFFMLAVDAKNSDLNEEKRVYLKKLPECAEDASNIFNMNEDSFSAAEGKIKDYMDEIVDKLRQQSNYAYLIE